MIFAVPLSEGRYLVYAPLRQIALVANAPLVAVLVDMDIDEFVQLAHSSPHSARAAQQDSIHKEPDPVTIRIDVRRRADGSSLDPRTAGHELATRLADCVGPIDVRLEMDCPPAHVVPDLVEAVSRAVGGARFVLELQLPGDGWTAEPTAAVREFLSFVAEARRRAARMGSAIKVPPERVPSNTEPFCSGCFARFDCPGPQDARSAFEGSSWCHAVRALLRDDLLARIAQADGLVWKGRASGAVPTTSIESSRRTPAAPRDFLHGIPAGQEPCALFPVLGAPWAAAFSRRDFLGFSLALGSAQLFLQGRVLAAPLLERRPIEVLPDLLGPPRAARQVDSMLLSAVGIEVAPGDGLPPGYRLRWFAGEDLELPPEAFPSDRTYLADFVSQRNPQPVQFNTEARDQKPGFNGGVPGAFAIYRRPHHVWYRATIGVTQAALTQLRAAGSASSAVTDVKLSYSARRARPPGAYSPRYGWPEAVKEWPEVSGVSRPAWASSASEVVAVRFEHAAGGKIAPRTVHVARFKCTAANFAAAPQILVEAYADGELEPVWQELIRAGVAGSAAPVERELGRSPFDTLLIVSPRSVPFELQFSFMDQDMLLPARLRRVPGEWEYIHSTRFITAFNAWTTAKENVFRVDPNDRYTNLIGTGAPTTADGLDQKYAPIFARLQQAFVRLRHAAQLELPRTLERRKAGAVEMHLEPNLLVNLWALDPNVASLFGFYHADIPGSHNSLPPTLGRSYDYLITASWMPPAVRLGYIVQDVSRARTPAVPPPRGLIVEQLDGIATRGRKMLYQVGVRCSVGRVAQPQVFGQYDAPLTDIRRRLEGEASFKLLTHRYDESLAAEAGRFIDSPLQATSFPPYPQSPDERADFTELQLAALSAQDKLQAESAEVVITATEAVAYAAMNSTPAERFFRLPEPVAETKDWIEAPRPGGSTTVAYDSRAVDIFGRVSSWHGAKSVTVMHTAEPPEAANVRAVVAKDTAGRDVLRVSWRMGARERPSGSPVSHFNVMARVVDARADLIRMLYVDLIGPEPTPAKRTFAASILDDPDKTVVDFIVAICESAEYKSKWIATTTPPAQRPAVLVERLYLQLCGRTPLRDEREAGIALVTDALLSGPLVRKIMEQPDYVPPNPRRFRYWRDHILNAAPIAYRPPIEVSILGVSGMSGIGVPVTIASAALATREIQARNAPWISGAKLASVVTTRRFRDLPLFVDVPRYSGSAGLLDQAKLAVGGFTYDIVGIECGDVLKLTVLVPGAVTDAATLFAPSAVATLAIHRFVESFAWTQVLSAAWLPEIQSDEDLVAATDKVAAFLERDEIVLAISAAASLDITGRENWLTETAWFEYADSSGTHRLAISDFGTLTLDLDHLRFGGRRAGSISTRVITLANRTSTTLTIQPASATLPFEIVGLQTEPIELAPDGALPIEVRFVAPAAGSSVSAQLQISTDVGVFSVELSGHVVAPEGEESQDTTTAMPRTYLAELTLAEVIREDERMQDSEDNPAPIFSTALLQAALSGGTSLTCQIRIPALRKIDMSALGATGASSLLNVSDGEISFDHTQFDVSQEFTSEFISPVWSIDGGNVASTLIREQPSLPLAPVVPTGSGTVYHSYRVEFAWRPPLPSKSNHAQTVSTAISVHAAPRLAGDVAAGWYPADGAKLISSPVTSDLSPLSPTAAVVPGIAVPQPWVDPFRTIYSSIPKMLDNRRVVQVKVDLGDPTAVGASPIGYPSAGDLALSRAPLDGLRALATRHLHKPVPPDALGDPYIGHLDDDADRAPKAVSLLNAASRQRLYEILSDRLIRYWDHQDYSLAAAFSPVGTIARGTATPRLIDELVGTASGIYFYSVKTVRRGASATGAKLLPFKLVVPSLHVPSAPTVTVARPLGSGDLISWPSSTDPDIYAYEIYRTQDTLTGTAQRTLIKTLYASALDKPTGGEVALRSPAMLRAVTRSMRARRQSSSSLATVDLGFPASTFGFEAAAQIVGVFRPPEVPEKWMFGTVPLDSLATNHWDSSVSGLSDDQRALTGIDLPHGAEVVVVFEDARRRRRRLSDVAFYTLDLVSVPSSGRELITGIYPIGGLTVQANSIPLLFGGEVHGIVSGAQVVGVFRARPYHGADYSDPGHGNVGALNHWTHKWPSGQPNGNSAMSPDQDALLGIELPRGTPVVIQYQGADGRTLLMSSFTTAAAAADPAFYGLLPNALSEDRNSDPANLKRVYDNRGALATIQLRMPKRMDTALAANSPVRIRYGLDGTIDQGHGSLLHEADSISSATYEVNAVRKVRTGPQPENVRMIRSKRA